MIIKSRYFLIPIIIPLIIIIISSIQTEPGQFESQMESKIFILLNQERESRGLLPLERDLILDGVAEGHSKDMAENDFFDHLNLKNETAGDRLDKANKSCIFYGENLAYATHYTFTAKDRMNALMASPSHREVILDDVFEQVGLSVEKGETNYYLTQVFCR